MFKPQPKPLTFRSEAYLVWLRGKTPICQGFGPTECHHIRLFKSGGTGIKPTDSDCVPVHWSVHQRIHQVGERQVLLVDAGFTIEQLRKMADDFYNEWLLLRHSKNAK